MKSLSLPLLTARARQLGAAAVVLVVATCAPALPPAVTGAGDGVAGAYQASVLPARLDPGVRTGPPPLAGSGPGGDERGGDEPGGDESGSAALPGTGNPVVLDLEAVDPEAEPLTATRLHHPAIRLHGEADAGTDAVAAAQAVEGVALATAVLVGSMALAPEEARIELEVAAVDTDAFRLLTPQVTAEAVEVWRRIAEGDAAFVHEVGHDLQHDHGIDLGDRVPLAGGDLEGEGAARDWHPDAGLAGQLLYGGGGGSGGVRVPSAPGDGTPASAATETVRIGAYASNGAPPVADVIVSRETAEALGLTGETVIIVALEDGAEAGEVARELEQATGLDAEVVPRPTTRRAFLSGGASRDAFEPFSYVSLGDGMIQIEREWVQRNIVTADVPVFRGHVTCHRLMIPQLRGALQEIEDRGLAHLIDPGQYGGCWVPRHILFNPNRAISMHAWGLAIDFNVSTNQYGAQPQLDRRIVHIFERWGFSWGGHWSTPDGMHFELAVLLDPDGE